MKLTTEKIIELLPVDRAFKDDLLKKLPTMDADTRYTVGKVIWDAYYVLYQLKLQENIRNGLHEMGKSPDPLDTTFYQKMVDKTEKDLVETSYNDETSSELESIRTKLQALSV